LVHSAVDGRYGWSSLSKRLAVRKNGASFRKLVDLRRKPNSAKALARVLYRQQILDTDLRDAARIYECLLGAEEQGVLEPVDHGYLVDALTILGRHREANNHLERYANGLRDLEAYTYLLANLLNPHSGGVGGEVAWLHQVNAPLTAHALEPIRLKVGNGAPFCRLACTAAHFVSEGPLVSVLMPVYESNDATDVAIGSILAQSWRNLELIVVDDASPESSRERLKKWENQDERLRIVYSRENRGAYCARNTAYHLARGTFVTVADKDDWHHPRKIELHARDLLDSPGKLANMSSWSRVDENLNFLLRYAPIKMAHPSQPSLFFRREPVKEALGYWDSVRKGADGEYKLRIQQVFGIEIKPMNRIPLALSLMGRENLSSRDFGLGYEHPDRSLYKQTYGHWHRRIGEQAKPYVPKEPERRPFPAPAAFLPKRCAFSRFDIIFAMDLSATTEEIEVSRTEILAALEVGMRIGVLHLPDLMHLPRKDRPPRDWLNDLILDGRVARISFTDRADAEILVIGTPRILQFRPELGCGISPQRVLVLANQAPFDPASGAYLPRTVADNIRSMFNADAVWVPLNNHIRLALTPGLRRQEIAPYEWKGIMH
jgi:glycosyltransferase involved in cell wall biosynthesis